MQYHSFIIISLHGVWHAVTSSASEDCVQQIQSFYGLYMPWKVTGDMMSTSALAISDRSLAFKIRQYVGLWAPGATTIVIKTPVKKKKK